MVKKNNNGITAQDITLAKLELFQKYFPGKEDRKQLDQIKSEFHEEQETFIAIVERLLCFAKEKRDKLPDGVTKTIWRFIKIKHNWYRTPKWCCFDPFVICTNRCGDCDSFGNDDPWKRLGWTYDEWDWLIWEDEIEAEEFDRKNDIGGAAAPIRESEDYRIMRKVDIALIQQLLKQEERTKGYREFVAATGYTVSQFTAIYEEFKRVIQEYYDNFRPEYGVKYLPLQARIGLQRGGGLKVVNFFFKKEGRGLSIEDECTSVSTLQGHLFYFAIGKREKIAFLHVEEVIRRLVILYLDNQEVFDSERRNRIEPLIPVEQDLLDDLKNLHFKRG